MASYGLADRYIKFRSTSEQLLALTQHRINNKKAINSQLEELNRFDYKTFIVPDNDTIMLLINSLCSSIQVSETNLVKNYCQFISNIFEAGASVTGRTFLTCKKWIFQVLEFSEFETRIVALIALKSLIDAGTFEAISQDIPNLLGEKGLLKILAIPDEGRINEVNYHAIHCVEGLMMTKERTGASFSPQHRKLVKQIATNVLFIDKSNQQNQPCYTKVICSCLKILSILLSTKLINDDPEATGEILGIVQAYLFQGLPGCISENPQLLRPAIMNLPDRIHNPPKGRNPRSSNKSKSKKSIPKKSLENSSNYLEATKNLSKSSDSETSDSESLNLTRLDLKIRKEAINLLHSAIQEIPGKQMYGFWSQIICNGTGTSSRVLIKLILKEPVSKLRQNALSTLTEAIDGAKSFLIHADDSEHPSFLTIFGTVAAIIKELHFSLSLLLSTEKNTSAIIHALKCSSSLIQATPYSRLKTGLATKLSRYCRPLINHKDPTVRVAVLSVFEAFSNIENITPEILTILNCKSKKGSNCQNKFDTQNLGKLDENLVDEEIDEIDAEISENFEIETIDEEVEENSEQMTILLENCLKNISEKTVHIPVRLQSLKLLGVLSSNIENSILNFLEIVTKTLLETFNESEMQVVLHSCRVLEIISMKLSSLGNEEIYSQFWNRIFFPVTSLAQSSNTNLREVACDCLGSINNTLFSQLSRAQNILIITTLFGAVRDEESAVRAAGLRSLGMLITLPSLEDQTGFVMDLADLVSISLDDQNLGVRVKAAWALANLTDCLIRQEKNDEIEALNLEFLLPKLYKVSINASKDNNKVKCNSLRAVGNVLYLSETREILGDVSQALNVLIDSAVTGNDMKVRWNACRALGFVISHQPDLILPTNWRDLVFPELCELIIHASNFKVRTNAAWALASCQNFGKWIPFVWKKIVLALDNSKHVPNFVEYGHRDTLVQQLCLALGHVAKDIEITDLVALWPEVKDHVDEVAGYMRSFQERVVPEKTVDFVEARLKIMGYAQNIALKDSERKIAEELAELFHNTCL